MSLNVPDSLLEKAQQGPISDDEFVECIRESLPYAWSVVEGLAGELRESGASSVQNLSVPPDEQAWGQLFRLVTGQVSAGAPS